jgi:hypothetical protein
VITAVNRHDRTATVASVTSQRWFRRLAVAAALGCVSVVAAVATPTSPIAEAQDTSLGAGGEYHPLTPTRIFDSRTGVNDSAPIGIKPTSPQGLTFNVDVLGQGGIPAEAGGVNSDVLAVVANVTVVGSTLGGFLSMYPTGAAPGESSLVNFAPREAVPNLAVLGIGVGGQSTISLVTPQGAGSAHVLIDVFGWISTSRYTDAADSGARFRPIAPSRVLDTRGTTVPAGWPSGKPIGTMEQLTLPIRGANGVVPDSANVTGVMVNITAANNAPGNQPTFLAATPTATPPGVEPATSVTNVDPGQIKANMAIVPVGDDGTIRLFNRSGATNVIVDVLGYLERGAADTSSTGRVVPLDAPFRAFDTRQAAFASTPLGFGTKEEWSFTAFAESVTLNGARLGAQSALIGNLTGTGLEPLVPGRSVNTYMTIYPGNGAPPNASNINVTPGRSVPNMSLLSYGTVGPDDYTISAFNFDGTIHYLLDVYAVVLK